MTETRKLRTIIFADIAGYTAMMQADEPRSLKVLNQFKEQVETQVPQHQGEIVQYFGDACLLSFESTTQAVACSLQMQSFFIPNDVPVRIGMHLGEVVFKNNNAFGDGVNIASRIESMGVPGAILLSKAIRDQIKNKPEFPVTLLGSYHFKNIEAPMDLYALSSEGLVVPRKGEMKGKLAPTAPGKSILSKLLKNRITQQIGIPLMIVVLGILSFFMFRNVETNAMTTTITFLNADGVEETREIVKEEFRKEFALFSFEPVGQQADTNAWIGQGIGHLLHFTLDQDKYLSPATILLPRNRFQKEEYFSKVEKIDQSNIYREAYYVDGQYQVKDGEYIITPAIRDKNNGSILQQKAFKGTDLFQLADSASNFIRGAIGLNNNQLEESLIIGTKEGFTASKSALKAYSIGSPAVSFGAQLDGRLINWIQYALEEALKHDSTFVFASLRYAQNVTWYSEGELEAKLAIKQAMRHRRKLPYPIQIEVMANRHWIFKDIEKAKKLIDLQLEIEPNNMAYQDLLSNLYWNAGQFDQLIAHEKARYAQNPNLYNGYRAINGALIQGKAEEAIQIAQELLATSPRKPELLMFLADGYLHQGNYQQARKTYENLILTHPELELSLTKILEAIAYLEQQPKPSETLSDFEGVYRFSINEISVEIRQNKQFPYWRPSSQQGFFLFPSGKSSFSYGDLTRGQKFEFLKTKQGNVYVIKNTINEGEFESVFYVWKQDSLIWKAEDLLKQGDYKNARLAYEVALAKHPEHYYLQQALQHLEYRQSHTTGALDSLVQNVAGTYRSGKCWSKEGLLYVKWRGQARRAYYPISDSSFITLNAYNRKLEFRQTKGQPMTLQAYIYDFEDQDWSTQDRWKFERSE